MTDGSTSAKVVAAPLLPVADPLVKQPSLVVERPDLVVARLDLIVAWADPAAVRGVLPRQRSPPLDPAGHSGRGRIGGFLHHQICQRDHVGTAAAATPAQPGPSRPKSRPRLYGWAFLFSFFFNLFS